MKQYLRQMTHSSRVSSFLTTPEICLGFRILSTRWARGGSALLLAGLTLILLLGSLQPALAAVCTVPTSHASIQIAVNDTNCDPINVMPGTYNETVVVNRSLTLQGTGGLAVVNGGGAGRPLTINGAAVTVHLNNLRLTGGNATSAPSNPHFGGGLLVAGGATLHAQNLQLDNNVATTGSSTGFGGGLAVRDGSAYLTGTLIYQNIAKAGGTAASHEGRGGGLYIAGNIGAGRAILHLVNSQVLTNTAYNVAGSARGLGGGLQVGESANTQLYLSGNTWQNNIARANTANAGAGDGGAVAVVTLNSQATATIINDVFTNNTANASNGTAAGDSASGGAIYIDTNAVVPGPGYNISANLINVTLRNNIAKTGTGSAVGQGGGLYAAESSLTYDRGLIEDNIAAVSGSGQGGGIRLSGGPMVAGRLTILNNIVRQSGGAATFLEGGGIQASGGGSDLNLTNSILAGNSASGGLGAGLYLNYSGVSGENEVGRITHVTVADDVINPAQAIYYTGSAADRLYITNTIVASHTTGIHNQGATGTVQENYSLFFANTSNTVGSVTGNVGSFTGNPAFTDPPGDDYHILPASLAVNAGTNAGVTDDIDGQSRDSQPDIGADEQGPAQGAGGFVYLPLITKN